MLKEQDTERYPVFVYKEKRYYINVVKGIDDRESSHDHTQEQRELEKTAGMLFGKGSLYAQTSFCFFSLLYYNRI